MSARNVILTLGVVAAVSATAVGFYGFRRNDAGPHTATTAVTSGPIADTVGATGTVEAVTTVLVGTQVSGTVKELHADFNSIVRKGQVIVTLDPSLFETQIEQARATLLRNEADGERLKVALADAETKLARAQELAGRRLIPTTELEAAEVNVRAAAAQLKSADAQVTQARASLNQAQVTLEHTIIRAPIDGIVISRNVDVGQTVAASMQAPTLFVLAADLTRMQVRANVDESDIGRVRPGQVARFSVDAYPDAEFRGRVSQVRLQPVVIQNVVSYVTVIDVPNPDLKLKPGMTTTVTLEIARRDNTVRVPNAALRFRPTREMFAALGQIAPGVTTAPTAAPAASVESAPRAATARDARSSDWRNAGTLDSLFGPLPTADAPARVWTIEHGRLTPIDIRVGLTDGANTELLAGELRPGAELVTSVSINAAAAAAPARNPLFPFPGRGAGSRGSAAPGGPRG